MQIATWRRALRDATDPDAVLEVMRRFIASLEIEERRALPLELRFGELESAEDIPLWARDLASAWLEGECPEGEGIPVVGLVSVVFAQASHRLAQFPPPRALQRLRKWITAPSPRARRQ